MALSGSSDHGNTALDLIEEAFLHIGELSEGDSLTGDMVARGRKTLNNLVKFLATKGHRLWKLQDNVLFLNQNQNEYALGPGGDKAAQVSDVSFTALSAAALSAATTLTVSSIAGIAASDNIGVKLTSGALFWTTVSGTPSGSTVMLASALTGAAASGNRVYAYPSGITKPMRIKNAYCRVSGTLPSLGTTSDIPMRAIGIKDYDLMPSKSATGYPTQYSFQPRRLDSLLKLFPMAGRADSLMFFKGEMQLQDLDANNNDLDVPSEWFLPLGFALADILSGQYGVDDVMAERVAGYRKEYMPEVDGWDAETADVFVNYGYEPNYYDSYHSGSCGRY